MSRSCGIAQQSAVSRSISAVRQVWQRSLGGCLRSRWPRWRELPALGRTAVLGIIVGRPCRYCSEAMTRSPFLFSKPLKARPITRILNSLPQSIFGAVEPHLKEVELVFGTVGAETEQPVDRVYFPKTGVVSLVVEMAVGDMIETAMVGHDGVVNGTSALDYRGIFHVAGSAIAIAPDILRSLADKFTPLRRILIRHEQVLFAQAQQSAGCNASHTVEARMCRWLLRRPP